MENKSKNTSEISQWIDNYLHISLDTEEYVEVRNFLILWNLFEAKWFKCNFGRNKRNIQNIHLTSDIFNQTLQYLQRRYITNGSTNERFMRLRLRNNDDTTSIQRVLLGLTNNYMWNTYERVFVAEYQQYKKIKVQKSGKGETGYKSCFLRK